jgi:hypothetical protein
MVFRFGFPGVFFGRPPLVTLPPNLVKLLFWMDRPAESVLEALPLVGLLQVDDQKLQKPYRNLQRLGALNGPSFTVNNVQILRSTPY